MNVEVNPASRPSIGALPSAEFPSPLPPTDDAESSSFDVSPPLSPFSSTRITGNQLFADIPASFYLSVAQTVEDEGARFASLIEAMQLAHTGDNDELVRGITDTASKELRDNPSDQAMIYFLEALYFEDLKAAAAILPSIDNKSPAYTHLSPLLEQEQRYNQYATGITLAVTQSILEEFFARIERLCASPIATEGEKKEFKIILPVLRPFFEEWASAVSSGNYGSTQEIFASIENGADALKPAQSGLAFFKKLIGHELSALSLHRDIAAMIQDCFDSENLPLDERIHTLLDTTDLYLLANERYYTASGAIASFFTDHPKWGTYASSLLERSKSQPEFDAMLDIGQHIIYGAAFLGVSAVGEVMLARVAQRHIAVRLGARILVGGLTLGLSTLTQLALSCLYQAPQEVFTWERVRPVAIRTLLLMLLTRSIGWVQIPVRSQLAKRPFFTDPLQRIAFDMKSARSIPLLNPTGEFVLKWGTALLSVNALAVGDSFFDNRDYPMSYSGHLFAAGLNLATLSMSRCLLDKATGGRYTALRQQAVRLTIRAKIKAMFEKRNIVPLQDIEGEDGKPRTYNDALTWLTDLHLKRGVPLTQIEAALDLFATALRAQTTVRTAAAEPAILPTVYLGMPSALPNEMPLSPARKPNLTPTPHFNAGINISQKADPFILPIITYARTNGCTPGTLETLNALIDLHQSSHNEQACFRDEEDTPLIVSGDTSSVASHAFSITEDGRIASELSFHAHSHHADSDNPLDIIFSLTPSPEDFGRLLSARSHIIVSDQRLNGLPVGIRLTLTYQDRVPHITIELIHIPASATSLAKAIINTAINTYFFQGNNRLAAPDYQRAASLTKISATRIFELYSTLNSLWAIDQRHGKSSQEFKNFKNNLETIVQAYESLSDRGIPATLEELEEKFNTATPEKLLAVEHKLNSALKYYPDRIDDVRGKRTIVFMESPSYPFPEMEAIFTDRLIQVLERWIRLRQQIQSMIIWVKQRRDSLTVHKNKRTELSLVNRIDHRLHLSQLLALPLKPDDLPQDASLEQQIVAYKKLRLLYHSLYDPLPDTLKSEASGRLKLVEQALKDRENLAKLLTLPLTSQRISSRSSFQEQIKAYTELSQSYHIIYNLLPEHLKPQAAERMALVDKQLKELQDLLELLEFPLQPEIPSYNLNIQKRIKDCQDLSNRYHAFFNQDNEISDALKQRANKHLDALDQHLKDLKDLASFFELPLKPQTLPSTDYRARLNAQKTLSARYHHLYDALPAYLQKMASERMMQIDQQLSELEEHHHHLSQLLTLPIRPLNLAPNPSLETEIEAYTQLRNDYHRLYESLPDLLKPPAAKRVELVDQRLARLQHRLDFRRSLPHLPEAIDWSISPAQQRDQWQTLQETYLTRIRTYPSGDIYETKQGYWRIRHPDGTTKPIDPNQVETAQRQQDERNELQQIFSEVERQVQILQWRINYRIDDLEFHGIPASLDNFHTQLSEITAQKSRERAETLLASLKAAAVFYPADFSEQDHTGSGIFMLHFTTEPPGQVFGRWNVVGRLAPQQKNVYSRWVGVHRMITQMIAEIEGALLSIVPTTSLEALQLPSDSLVPAQLTAERAFWEEWKKRYTREIAQYPQGSARVSADGGGYLYPPDGGKKIRLNKHEAPGMIAQIRNREQLEGRLATVHYNLAIIDITESIQQIPANINEFEIQLKHESAQTLLERYIRIQAATPWPNGFYERPPKSNRYTLMFNTDPKKAPWQAPHTNMGTISPRYQRYFDIWVEKGRLLPRLIKQLKEKLNISE